MRALPFLLLAGFLLSGCSGGLTATDSTSTGGTTGSFTTDEEGNVVPVDNATVYETGTPVHIEEDLDLTTAGAKDYNWDLKNGYRTFKVTVTYTGAGGAVPAFAAEGSGHRLVGGTPPATVSEATGSPTAFNGGSPGVCFVCYEPAAGDDPNKVAGAWSLHLEWGPSAAGAHVLVDVTY